MTTSLRAVEDPVVAVPARPRRHGGRVGAVVGLAGPKLVPMALARGHPRQPLLLLPSRSRARWIANMARRTPGPRRRTAGRSPVASSLTAAMPHASGRQAGAAVPSRCMPSRPILPNSLRESGRSRQLARLETISRRCAARPCRRGAWRTVKSRTARSSSVRSASRVQRVDGVAGRGTAWDQAPCGEGGGAGSVGRVQKTVDLASPRTRVRRVSRGCPGPISWAGRCGPAGARRGT